MSHRVINQRYQMAAADTPNVDSAGAVAEFVFPNPVVITKVGLTVTTTIVTDGTTDFTATMSRRPILGSSSNEVDLGVFKMAEAGVDPAAGDVIWKELAIADHDGETPEDSAGHASPTRNEAPNSDAVGPITGLDGFLILPGQSFVMTLDSSAEADSGAARAWVEYVDLPFNGVYIDQDNISRDTTND